MERAQEAASSRHGVIAGAVATPHGLPTGVVRLVGLAAFLSLLIQNGFPWGFQTYAWFNALNIILAVLYTLDLLFALQRSRHRKLTFSMRRFEYLGLLSFGVVALGTALVSFTARERILDVLHVPSTEVLGFALLKLFLLGVVAIQASRAALRLFVSGVRPELVLAASFVILIAVGTLLLVLPRAGASPEHRIGPVDALFTATSAACVTGLGVRDTGGDFSTFGQMVIMGLFQIGGLGIISFVAFLSVFSTPALPVSQMVIFRQVVNAPAASDLKRQFTGILLTTFLIEAIGVLLLLRFYPGNGDWLAALGWSSFHAVSAFCNAGFALQSDSLVPYANNAGLILSVCLLIILGGLGFLVIPELLTWRHTRGLWFRLSRTPVFRRFIPFRSIARYSLAPRLSVQAKLALSVMIALLLIGFVGFWVLEKGHLLAKCDPGASVLASVFQSVTARTAGFNTVPIQDLQPPTIVLLLVLMVIGANPVSTGGGIKTVSFGILLLALRAMITRRDRVEAFGRTIPTRTLFAALAVFGIYILSAVTGVFLLTITDPRFTFQQQVFEVISALSTVGLSMGITADLSVAGKLVICVAMFIGRVGPISLVLSVFHSPQPLTYEFPEEEVVVG